LVRRLFVTALLFAAAVAARGEDACTAAVARLCPASRGDLLLLGCLRAHEAEISRACPGDLDAVLAKAQEIGESCDGDVAKLCPNVQAGGGRVVACLQANESNLSQGCQAAFNEWRLMRMRLVAACAGDIGKFCRMVPEGGGRIFSCLKAHEGDLSSDCRTAMEKL